MKVKELINTLYEFNEEDEIVLSTCDENGDEIDLYDFYIDAIANCEDINGRKFTEVRICQLPHKNNDFKTWNESPYGND
jgi:agmatine/peptidylarginine deiminase